MPKIVNEPRGNKRRELLDAAEEHLQQLEAQRPNEEAWSPRRAFDAQLCFLAAIEAIGVAAFVEENEVFSLAARGHAVHATRRMTVLRHWRERVKHAADMAALGAFAVADLTCGRAEQEDALAGVWNSAGEIRWRVSMIRPDLERSLRSRPLRWDHTAGFADAVLPWFDKARNNPDGRLEVVALGVQQPDVFAELNGHFAALAGDPVVPPLSQSLQFAQSYLSAAEARAQIAEAFSPPTPPLSRWEQLLDVLDGLHREHHPLAPLLGFVEAAQIFGLSMARIEQRPDPATGGSTVVIPRLPLLAVEALASTRRGDGARNHAERAVQTLGWRVTDVSEAERSRQRRKQLRRAQPKGARSKARCA